MRRAALLLGFAILSMDTAAAQRCETMMCRADCAVVKKGNVCTCKCPRPLSVFEGLGLEMDRASWPAMGTPLPNPYDPGLVNENHRRQMRQLEEELEAERKAQQKAEAEQQKAEAARRKAEEAAERARIRAEAAAQRAELAQQRAEEAAERARARAENLRELRRLNPN